MFIARGLERERVGEAKTQYTCGGIVWDQPVAHHLGPTRMLMWQASQKITNEAPKGIRANLLGSMHQLVTEQGWEGSCVPRSVPP